MKIGIIGAMSVEIDLIKKEIVNVHNEVLAGYTFYHGNIGNNDVILVRGGIGKVSMAACVSLMCSNYHIDVIINTGIAGGVFPLKTEDIFVAKKIMYHDVDATIFNYKLGQVPGFPLYFLPNDEFLLKVDEILNKNNYKYQEGIILSGDKFVSSYDIVKPFIENDKTSYATEMEGGALGQTAYIFKVPFVSIRYISDIIGSDNQNEDYLTFEEKMANRSSHICLAIIKGL